MSAINEITSTIKYWWIYLILGILFIFGSFYIYSTPLVSYLTLSIFFAAFMLVDGVGGIAFSVSNRDALQGWGWQLAGGIISTLIGLGLVMYPALSMAILPIYVGFWVLMKGSLITGVAIDLRSHKVKNWGWVLALGVLNVILGMVMILNPIFGASMVLVFTSLAILTMGFSLVFVSLMFRKIKHGVTELKTDAKEKLEDIKASVENFIKNEPEDVQNALKHLKSKVDNALAKD